MASERELARARPEALPLPLLPPPPAAGPSGGGAGDTAAAMACIEGRSGARAGEVCV